MDIELAIKLPEELYEAYKSNPPKLGDAGMDMIAQSIANGIPIPKKHGRIGDLDTIMNDISNSINEMTNIGIGVDGEYLWAKLNDAIDNASTIIPAGAESDDKILDGIKLIPIAILNKMRAELIQSIQNGTLKIESGNEELFRIIDKCRAESEAEE